MNSAHIKFGNEWVPHFPTIFESHKYGCTCNNLTIFQKRPFVASGRFVKAEMQSAEERQSGDTSAPTIREIEIRGQIIENSSMDSPESSGSSESSESSNRSDRNLSNASDIAHLKFLSSWPYTVLTFLLRISVTCLVRLPTSLIAVLYRLCAILQEKVEIFFYGSDSPPTDDSTPDPLTDTIRRFPSHAAWFMKWV